MSSGLRTIGFSLATVLIAAGALAQTNAERPAGVGGGNGLARSITAPGGAGFIMVLMTPAVQDELKLSADQKAKVFDLARDAQQKGRVLLQSALQAGGTPQARMTAGMRLRQENETAAAAILQPEQKERIEQIMLQVEGPLAVVRPEVANKLNMTARQNQLAQQTLMQMGQAVRELLIAQAASGGNIALGPAGLPREAMNRIRGAATQQLGRILDAKQKFQFNKMLGAPFDLAKIDPELAEPTPTDTSAAPKVEKSRSRRKGVASSKAATAVKDDGADAGTPKP